MRRAERAAVLKAASETRPYTFRRVALPHERPPEEVPGEGQRVPGSGGVWPGPLVGEGERGREHAAVVRRLRLQRRVPLHALAQCDGYL